MVMICEGKFEVCPDVLAELTEVACLVQHLQESLYVV